MDLKNFFGSEEPGRKRQRAGRVQGDGTATEIAICQKSVRFVGIMLQQDAPAETIKVLYCLVAASVELGK